MTDQEDGSGPSPVQILKQGTSVTSGITVQQRLITAASSFADLLRPTYGPKGLDKMMYKTSGETAITNDGAKIVSELLVKHPSAKAFVSLGQSQESFAGDGVTGCLLFTGALMHEAGLLLERGLHPLQLIDGYSKALEITEATITTHSRPFRDNELASIARTSMTGKLTTSASDQLADIVVEAINLIRREESDTIQCYSEDVMMCKSGVGTSTSSRLIRGLIIEKRVAIDRFPQHITSASVAVFDSDLTYKKPQLEAEIEVKQPEQITRFIEEEDRQIDSIIAYLLSSKIRAVFCTGEVHKNILHTLAAEGVFVLGQLEKIEAERICKVSGATLLNRVEDLSSSETGIVGSLDVERDRVDDEIRERIVIDGCTDCELVTIEVGGSTDLEVEELIRAIHDALKSTALTVREGEIIPGGGFPHAASAAAIRSIAEQQSSRSRLGMEAFSRALETIPASLAANAGRDSLNTILELRSGLLSGKTTLGVGIDGEVSEMRGVFEPTTSLKHSLRSATQCASSLLRVDQLISSRGD